MADVAQWYYSIAGQQAGPITGSELKRLAVAGTLSADDFVRKEGASDWVAARRIKGLFPHPSQAAPSAPPPGPTAPAGEPPNVAAAASNLFGALTSAAKRVGARVQAAAKDASAPPPVDNAVEGPTVFSRATPKRTRRTWIMVAAGGGLFLSCGVCAGIGSLIGLLGPGRTKGLGVSQQQVFEPKPDFSLPTEFQKVGRPLTQVRENAEWRVWGVGKMNRLALSGPEGDLTAVAVLTGYTTDQLEINAGMMLTMAITAPLLNPKFAEGGKWPESDDLFKWMTRHIEGKTSGERTMNGRRVVFGTRFPVCNVLLITAAGGVADVDEVKKQILDG